MAEQTRTAGDSPAVRAPQSPGQLERTLGSAPPDPWFNQRQPQDEGEVREMFVALAKKNRVLLAADALPSIKPDRFLSGSDIESVVLAAQRQVLASGRKELERKDIETAFGEFIP